MYLDLSFLLKVGRDTYYLFNLRFYGDDVRLSCGDFGCSGAVTKPFTSYL